MNFHVGKRRFVVAAVVAAVAVLALGFLVAVGVRSVVADPGGSAPNPGHSWSEIGDLPGTMWHSNNDGPGSGLDADLLDGLDSTAFSTGPHTTSLPWSAITSKPAGFADDIDDDILGGLSCANGEIAKWDGLAWQCGADVDTDTQLSEGQVETYVTNGPLDLNAATTLGGASISTGPHTTSLPWSSITTKPAGFADDIDDDILGGLSCANGEIAKWDGSAWQCAADETGAGGDFWSLTGNAGTTPSTHFLGTTDNQALELHVNSARALRLEPHATSPNLIGGYSGNSVISGVYGAAIGGGGNSGHINEVRGTFGTVAGGWGNIVGLGTAGGTVGGGYANQAVIGGVATVGGGQWNRAMATCATVGGGYSNDASGDTATVAGGHGNDASGDTATVAGGWGNTASGLRATVGGGWSNRANGDVATVGGGQGNTASGRAATVGGGDQNIASGWYATVPGGALNTAQGGFSFAAGFRAKANNDGCFVWGDFTQADLTCNDDNRFIVRGSGGVYFYTNSGLTSGSYLAAGSSSWSSVSDRDLKENFTPVDGQEVLASLAEIPITAWNYEAQDSSIRHMGPVAQDFYAAFGLGESDTAISTVDLDGVALAAIQGLYELAQEQDARIQALEAENASLQQQLDGLEARVAALEGEAGVSGGSTGPLSSAMPFGPLLLGGLVLGGLVLVQRRRARD